jgi:hypothetical protein
MKTFDDFWDYYRTKRTIPTLAGKGNATIEVYTTDDNLIVTRKSGTQAHRSKHSCRKDFTSLPKETDDAVKSDRRYVKSAIKAWNEAMGGATLLLKATQKTTKTNTAPPACPSARRKTIPASSAPTLSVMNMPKLPVHPKRNDFIEALVQWIQDEPYQLFKIYKGNTQEHSPLVNGWDHRLTLYSYANSNTKRHYQADYATTKALLAKCKPLAKSLKTRGMWTIKEQNEAEQLAVEIIEKWGGIRAKQNKSAERVESVFRIANGMPLIAGHKAPPMNSSWTKVAAFASGRNGHVIWDSRASASVTWRLDQLQTSNSKGTKTNLFDKLTLVKANGRGTRDRSVLLAWAKPEGSWDEQTEATRIAKEIVNVLNDPLNGYPRMPIPDIKGRYRPSDWDVWGVGQVLFMDGY